MAPAPAPQKPMPKPKASPSRREPTIPRSGTAKPLAEALQPLKVHFERVKQWAGKVQIDFERLRTIENRDELREAMRQHSLMLDQLQMMLIEHEALLKDQMRPAAGAAERPAVETSGSSAPAQGAHTGHPEQRKP